MTTATRRDCVRRIRHYGTTRERGKVVSYAEVERAARAIMERGHRPTSKAVLEQLGRGSPNHIGECLRRFWKDQAAMNAGDPLALSRMPPELADAAVAQWRLSQQSAKHEDNEARSRLEQLTRETEIRIRSVEAREKEWDMAARLRERALMDAREQIGMLVKELANASVELRSNKFLVEKLQAEIEDYRRYLSAVITRAVGRSRKSATKAAAKKQPQARHAKAVKAKSKRRQATKKRRRSW